MRELKMETNLYIKMLDGETKEECEKRIYDLINNNPILNSYDFYCDEAFESEITDMNEEELDYE